MKTLTLAPLRTLEGTAWYALKKFDARVKANPGVEQIKRHRDALSEMWQCYRTEIQARERAAAAKEEVVFTTFEPKALGMSATREIRRTKNFELTGFWWRGVPPSSFNVERKAAYFDPLKHFALLNQKASA